jgi:hypothetical protein
MADPASIYYRQLGRAGKGQSKVRSLREAIEELEAAQRADPQQMAQTVEDIRYAASRQRAERPTPAVLSPDELTPDGPAVPPPTGPFMPPPGDDFAAILQAVGPRPEVLEALRAKARQYQADLAAGRPAVPLSVEESLALVSAGDDPADVFGRQLTKREYDQIMRNVVKGVPISPEAAAALRRSPAGDVIEQNWQGTLTPDQQAALEASNFDLSYGGVNNLTPNDARVDPAIQVADAVRQYTTPTALESVSVEGVKRLAETIQRDYPAGSPQRAELEQAFAGWSPNPGAPDLPPPDYAVRAMEDGRRRLAALEQMASDSNFTQEAVAAEAIQRAAQSRAGGTGPRSGGSFVPEEPGLAAVVSRFNELPLDVRQAIVRRLGADSPARRFVAMEGGEVSIAPNAVAEALRPVNDVSDLIEQMDAAKRMGDQSTVDAVSQLVRQAPEADRRAAIAQFRERMAIEAALRQGMEAVSPTPAVAASPGPTALRPQGAMTPEFAVAPPDRMPGAFEEAEAAFNQSATQRETQRPRTFNRDRAARLEAIRRFVGKPTDQQKVDKIPHIKRTDGMFFKGGDRRLEKRADSARMVDSNDTKAIRSAREADDAWQAKRDELNAAYDASVAEYYQALEDAGSTQLASDPSSLAAAVKRAEASKQAMQAADAARRKWARQGPVPTYVNARGEEVRADELIAEYRKNFPNNNELSIRKMLADDGWEERAIGKAGWSDARLSKAASAQTMDGIVGALLEHKPKPQVNLNRSSDMLSPGDVAAQNDEARDLLRGMIEEGDLPVELDTTEDVADRARRGRLGGGSAASRREAALQGNSTGGLFGSYNPLELKLGSDNLYASARDLAADVLEETDSYHSRTPNYETNLERLTELLEDVYGPNSRNEELWLPDDMRTRRKERQQREALLAGQTEVTETDPAGAKRDPMTQEPDQVPTRIMQPEGHPAYELENRRGEVLPQRVPRDLSQPETVLTPEQLAELAENENALPPSAVRKAVGERSARRREAAAKEMQKAPLPDTMGRLRPPAAGAKSAGSGASTGGTSGDGLPESAGGLPPPPSGDASVNANLEASATSANTTVGVPDRPVAARSAEEIKDELNREYDDVVQQHYDLLGDDPRSENDKWREAQDTAGKWYRQELARRLAANQPSSQTPPGAAAATNPPAAAGLPQSAGGLNPPPGTAAATPTQAPAGAAPPSGPPPGSPPGTAAATPTPGPTPTPAPTPAPTPTPRTWGQWARMLGTRGAILTAAGTGGLYVMQPKTGPAPIDLPPIGPVPPLPVDLTSGSAAAGRSADDQAAALERALERIRGGRSSSTQSAPYATIQNPTMWR